MSCTGSIEYRLHLPKALGIMYNKTPLVHEGLASIPGKRGLICESVLSMSQI